MAKKAEVHILFNGSQAKNGISDLNRLALLLAEDLKRMGAELQQIELTLGRSSQEYKNLSNTISATQQRMKAYTTATDVEVEKTRSLSQVIADLSNSKLRDLKRALGSAKSQISGLTGSPQDLARGKQIREQMRQIMNQARLIEGEYVNMTTVMQRLGNVSNTTLAKAIKQQQEEVNWTNRGTGGYTKQLAVLQKLQAEQAKRNAAAMGTMTTKTAVSMAATGAIQTSSGVQKANLNQMRTASAVITNALANTTDPAAIKTYTDALTVLNSRMEAFSVSTKKTKLTQQELNDVIKNMSTAKPEQLRQAMSQLELRLKKLALQGKQNSTEAKKLQGHYDALNTTLQNTINKTVSVSDVMKRMRSGNASIEEMRLAYQKLEMEMNKLRTADPGFKKKQQEAAALKKQIDSVTGAMSQQSGWFKNAIKNIGAYIGVFGAFNMVRNQISKVISLNKQLDEALTNIRKVATDLTTKDIRQLSVELAKIDTRTTIEGLNQIAYAGAKLGMGKYGVDGLRQFTEAANQVNVALKEDMGDEALTQLSKITEVMGLIPKYGVEKAMLKTGSAIFRLASTSTATSDKIVNFSRRLMAMSNVTQVTTPELLALGAAADSMGLQTEVAATSFNKLMMAISKNPGAIEKALGITDKSITNYVKQGETLKAMIATFEAMNKQKNMLATPGLFKALGSEGSRLQGTMVTMANKVDMLKTALETSNEAFKSGTAVTQEYNLQQQTTAAIFQRASNLWEKAFVNQQGIDRVKELAMTWYDVSKALTTSSGSMTVFNTLLGMIFTSMKFIMSILPGLLTALLFKGVSAAILGLYNSFMMVGEASLIAKIRADGFLTTLKGMKASMIMNWFTGLIFVITELAIVFTDLNKKTQQALGFMEGFKKTVKEMSGEIEKSTANVRYLYDAINKAGQKTNERKALIQQFNKDYGKYLNNLLKETASATDLANAYNQVCFQLRRKAMLELRQKDYDKYVTPAVGWTAQAAADLDTQAKTNNNLYNTSRVKGILADKGNIRDAFNAVAKGLGITDADQLRYIWGRGSSANNSLYEEGNRNGAIHVGNSRLGYRWVTGTKQMEQLQTVASWLQKQAATTNRETQVYNKWKGYNLDEEEKPDKHEIEIPETNVPGNGLKPEGPERPETPEDPLAKAKAQIATLRKQIMTYYEQQMNYMKEQMVADGVDADAVEVFLRPLQLSEQKALDSLDTTLVQGTEAWKENLAQVAKDMKDPNSFGLLDEIQGADVMGMRTNALAARPKGWKAEKGLVTWINKKGKEQTGRGTVGWASRGFKPEDQSQLFMASLNYDQTKEEKKNLDLLLKQQKERQKQELEHDYTGTVQRNSAVQMLNLGFAQSDYKDWESTVEPKVIAMLEKARTNIAQVLASGGDKKTLIDLLGIKKGDEALQPILDAEGKDFQLFYQKLIQYSDQYTEAQKKNYDEQKKVVDMMWKLSKNEASQTKRQQTEDWKKNTFGEQMGFGARFGFADKSYDPEVEGYKLKLQFAKEYYDFVMANTQNVTLQQEAQMKVTEAQNALTQQLVASMKERMQLVKEFSQPIVEFGSAMGEALGQMSDDAESAQEAIRSAVKSMLKSWGEMMINNVMGQMWQGLNNGQTARVVASQPTTVTKPTVTKPAATPTTNKPVDNSEVIDTNAKAQAKMAVAVEQGKYADIYKVEGQYQEDSLNQWKAYADMKQRILDDKAKSNPSATTPSPTQEGVKTPTPSSSNPAEPTAPSKPTTDVSTLKANTVVVKADGGNVPQNGTPASPVTDATVTDDMTTDLVLGGTSENPLYVAVVNGMGMEGGEAVEGGTTTDANGNVVTTGGVSVARGGGNGMSDEIASAGSNAVSNAVNVAANGGDATSVGMSLAGSAISSGLNAAMNYDGSGKKQSKSADNGEQQRKKQYKKEEQDAKKQAKKLTKIEKEKQSDINSEVKDAGNEKAGLAKEVGNVETQVANATATTLMNTQKTQDKSELQEEGQKQQTKAAMHSAGMYGMCVDTLGPIAGPIAFAAMQAVLMGLLNYALSLIGGSGEEASTSSTASVNTKLVSGMLTYDKGNLQQLFIGNDGRIYSAQQQTEELGTGIVDHPIATTVNGQPSLVAENGPELVVGRETTAAMMQNAPQLLQTLLQFDKNHSLPSGGRTLFDSGNLSDVSGDMSLEGTTTAGQDNTAMMTVLTQMTALLNNLATNGVHSHINMYGRGGMYDKMQKATQFMKNK